LGARASAVDRPQVDHRALHPRRLREGDGGGWLLTGCAWGGERPIASVEVSTDGGSTWQPARLQTPAEYFQSRGDELPAPALAGAWGVFTCTWLPPGPGTYKLGCRAIDDSGAVQLPDNDPAVHGHFNQTRIKWRTVHVPERRSLPPGR
jgi:hypothetical protein